MFEEQRARPEWGRGVELRFADALERGEVLPLAELKAAATAQLAAVEQKLRSSATDADDFFAARGQHWRDFCPPPSSQFVYPDLVGGDPNVPFEAVCEGGADFNGFYGDGVVDALAAVSS